MHQSALLKHNLGRSGSGVGCAVVEWVERSTLGWFSHIEKIKNKELGKKMYLSSVEGPSRRGRPLRRWEGRVKEYMSGRGVRSNGLGRARRECVGRERWRSFCRDQLCLVPCSLYFNFCVFL